MNDDVSCEEIDLRLDEDDTPSEPTKTMQMISQLSQNLKVRIKVIPKDLLVLNTVPQLKNGTNVKIVKSLLDMRLW